MNIKEYDELLNKIIQMSLDWDMITEKDENSPERLKKATYVYGMLKCISDVPLSHIEYYYQKKRKINLDKLLDELYDEKEGE